MSQVPKVIGLCLHLVKGYSFLKLFIVENDLLTEVQFI